MNAMHFLSPILCLGAGSVLVLLGGLWFRRSAFLLATSILALVAAAALLLSFVHEDPQRILGSMLVLDPFGLFFALYAVATTGVSLLIGLRSSEIHAERRADSGQRFAPEKSEQNRLAISLAKLCQGVVQHRKPLFRWFTIRSSGRLLQVHGFLFSLGAPLPVSYRPAGGEDGGPVQPSRQNYLPGNSSRLARQIAKDALGEVPRQVAVPGHPRAYAPDQIQIPAHKLAEGLLVPGLVPPQQLPIVVHCNLHFKTTANAKSRQKFHAPR